MLRPKWPKPLLFCFSALLFSANIAASADETPLKTQISSEQLITELETFIPELMHDAGVPGLSIAVIREAKILWHASFGVCNLKGGAAVNDSTVFQAASLSKTLFAYAVLQLVESGDLELDTSLAEYWGADYVESDPRVRLITARMVLSHTTGFPNWRPRDGELQIYFNPGDKFSYSGEGYVYLQRVVEKLTGKPLDQIMTELVFEPLGMPHSSYVWRDSYEQNYATGHAEFGVPITRDPMTKPNAAFSLYTTAHDYAKFLIAMMQGRGLTENMMQEMLSPQIQLNEDCVNCTRNASSNFSENNAWGLGWGLQITDEGTSFWHWGDQGIYRCYTVAFKDQKIGLVYFTNSENGLAVRDAIVERAIGGEHPAFTWLHYDSYDSPEKVFGRFVVDEGFEAGMRYFNSLKSADKNTPPIKERAINNLGYHFLRSKQLEKAIEIFSLNVREYPNSWNVYDSLAEAYMENGQNDLAIENYQKSLQLNPDNANAKKMLAKLLNE